MSARKYILAQVVGKFTGKTNPAVADTEKLSNFVAGIGLLSALLDGEPLINRSIFVT